MLSSTGDFSSSFPYWLSFCFVFRLAAGVLIFVFLTLQNRWVYDDTRMVASGLLGSQYSAWLDSQCGKQVYHGH
jgi:hypothetical protein